MSLSCPDIDEKVVVVSAHHAGVAVDGDVGARPPGHSVPKVAVGSTKPFLKESIHYTGHELKKLILIKNLLF